MVRLVLHCERFALLASLPVLAALVLAPLELLHAPLRDKWGGKSHACTQARGPRTFQRGVRLGKPQARRISIGDHGLE